jgi:competence protein ComEC
MLLSGIIKRQLAIILTFCAIGIYTLIAGAEPPVIRAALMGSFAYIGQYLGKQTVGLLMLFWSGLIMILIEPEIIFSISFILSFSATFGILIFAPFIRSIIKKPQVVSEAVATSLSAWIITLPILVIAFGQASIVSVIPNVLVNFMILPIMILGFLMLIVGFLLPAAALLIGFLVYLPLTYMIFLANVFSQLPFATINFESNSIYVAIIYYLILLIIFKWLNQNYSKKVSS